MSVEDGAAARPGEDCRAVRARGHGDLSIGDCGAAQVGRFQRGKRNGTEKVLEAAKRVQRWPEPVGGWA